ncbi:MAG: hypothetical protein ABFS46_20250 [Myxococcota bacterium]
MAKRSAPRTERDRYWLRQHGACEKSGLTAKAYARRQRLSIHALYQARKRLRAMGALKPAAPRPSQVKARASGGFARVEAPTAPRPRYRVRLPNGALVEWDGASGPELAEVLGAVSQIR